MQVVYHLKAIFKVYAGAFLLPEEPFLKDMQAVPRVLGYRAANLELLDARSHRNFYAALHRKGYLKMKPLDETIPIQKPQKVKSIIDLVAKKGMIDMRQMIENDWMAEIAFFHRLTAIDQSFFSSYMTWKRDFELVNVDDLASGVRENRK
uniref:Uncharacterized protein n=1 Tax=Batrachochytrium dendrobatidis (strain JAM81 / FGSC 10211) TaxID=684364 RepID=F4PF50_BATDJ|eukprot:XP_006683233.1 hypothetical protein BATDEDRAFT_28786 [Batrachochytrium dendrobatidis JAM81]